MTTLFQVAPEELKKIEEKRQDRKALRLLEYAKAYNAIKSTSKGVDSNFCSLKKANQGKPKFIFLNRVVTPLLIAYEKAVESLLPSSEFPSDTLTSVTSSETDKIQENFLKLSIEDSVPDFNYQRKQSLSVKLKRSYREMQKIDSSLESLLSLSLLNSVFAYLDYESCKFSNPQCIIIGKLATVMYEVMCIK
jgi:hypothetical protein